MVNISSYVNTNFETQKYIFKTSIHARNFNRNTIKQKKFYFNIYFANFNVDWIIIYQLGIFTFCISGFSLSCDIPS